MPLRLPTNAPLYLGMRTMQHCHGKQIDIFKVSRQT